MKPYVDLENETVYIVDKRAFNYCHRAYPTNLDTIREVKRARHLGINATIPEPVYHSPILGSRAQAEKAVIDTMDKLLGKMEIRLDKEDYPYIANIHTGEIDQCHVWHSRGDDEGTFAVQADFAEDGRVYTQTCRIDLGIYGRDIKETDVPPETWQAIQAKRQQETADYEETRRRIKQAEYEYLLEKYGK